jgi:D-citramalate synthase
VENGATKLRVGYPPFYYPDFSGTEKPLDVLEETLEYARTLGLKIGLGFNMGPNVEAEYVARFLNRGLDTLEQAESILISDPYNCLGPDGIRSLMAFLKRETGGRAPLTPHVHNMMGLAVMTTLAAVQGGARAVDVVVNGIGAHCGHTSFEETVVALEVLYGLDTGIELEKLYDLSRVVAECTEMPIPADKPIVGGNAFLYEHSSMATDMLRLRQKGQDLDRPIAAGLVGQQAAAVWGRNTMSVDSIKAKLVDMDLDPDPEMADKILARAKELLRGRSQYPRYLTEAEMEELIGEEI